ncbi:MAG: hypothetical protein QOG91_314 [Candidatus Parcubacteria bacterium]|nr:hypothetical protein [Candidatus Parcubacteria bacterium]
MVKLFISKRVVFPRHGMQRDFLFLARKNSGKTWKDFAEILGVHQRTLRDWTREKFRLPHFALKTISEIGNIEYPIIETFELTEHLSSIAVTGGEQNFRKHGSVGGNQDYRLRKWRDWWKKEGKSKITVRNTLDIKIPIKNERLAEFMGIMIGDGGVAPYHIAVTLHSIDDKVYSLYVSDLIFELFGIRPKIYPKKSSLAIDIVVHRKKLVDHCISLGLNQGDKIRNGLDIPAWIQSDPRWAIACIRGIFDTDGCIFTHTYNSNGKEYSYQKIEITSASPPLIISISKILKKQGFHARIGSRGTSVHLESQSDIRMFKTLVGTHNQKNLPKFEQFGDVPERLKGAPC